MDRLHDYGESSNYAKYRPGYPKALEDRILELVTGRDHHLDVATGTGQVASEMANHFVKVDAIDASAS
jgi:ubiquinone/menaquinone biosynthesis C-methylase UbiE